MKFYPRSEEVVNSQWHSGQWSPRIGMGRTCIFPLRAFRQLAKTYIDKNDINFYSIVFNLNTCFIHGSIRGNIRMILKINLPE